MAEEHYRDRCCWRIQNDHLRVTVLKEGGHIAEIYQKRLALNPLWTPPWNTIEPSTYNASLHPEYGSDAESKLLCGIMGHNACVDLFGGPSADEARAGLTVHGESSVVPYEAVEFSEAHLIVAALLPLAGLRFKRELRLSGETVQVEETIENSGACDRPIAHTQHVTLGPPFLSPGETTIELPGGRSRTFEGDFGSLYPRSFDFSWPYVPSPSGEQRDMRTYPGEDGASGYTAHLIAKEGFFHVTTPRLRARVSYQWNPEDFPWIGIWIENCARQSPPWNGKTTTLGMEFGVSPMPETRKQMIERGKLFGVPTYRWIGAKQSIRTRYSASVTEV